VRWLQWVEGEDSPVARSIIQRMEQAQREPAGSAALELDAMLRTLKTPMGGSGEELPE
jgi:hypothetical protein